MRAYVYLALVFAVVQSAVYVLRWLGWWPGWLE